MNVALSLKIWKYILLTANCFFSLATMFLVSYGVLALGCAGHPVSAYIAAAIGFFAMTVCFVGCFAALRESYIISCVFIGTVIIAIISQIILMIAFAAAKNDLSDATRARVEGKWALQNSTEPGAMDDIHVYYKCCGRDSPQDYLKDDDDELPVSCCVLQDCSVDANIFAKGCIDTAIIFFDDQADSLILSILGNIVFEVIGLVSCYFLVKVLQAQQPAKPEPAPIE